MEQKRPLISIVTPVYNREDCIAQCLESVRRQSGEAEIEHIVVDDGSTDGTYAEIEAFAKHNPYVKALRMARNSGTNAARNAAIAAAAGRFTLILDSDDTLAPGALRLIADTIAGHPDMSHLLFAVDDRRNYYAAQGYADGGETSLAFRDFLEERVEGDFAHVVLTDTLRKYPFDERLRIFEGITFLSFYKEAGKMLFVNTTALNRDRGRNDRVSYTLIADNRRTLERHIAAIELRLSRFRDDLATTETGRSKIAAALLKCHKFATMTGDRRRARQCKSELEAMSRSVPRLYDTLNTLHAGPAFFTLARLYIKLKYRFKHIE